MEERLQKVLSAAGICSRRAAEDYITAGRVTVNGVPAKLGEKADPERDDVRLDGKRIGARGESVCLLLNKPRGYVTTLSDEKGRKTVADLVAGSGARVWPVGRLDMDSEGLLLLTDDGALTHQLLHPSHQVEKEYLVWVTGNINKALPILSAPMALDGEPIRAARVKVLERHGETARLSVVIHEGKNRQVRRMCRACGLRVERLRRVREHTLTLGSLPPGKWRRLTASEVEALR